MKALFIPVFFLFMSFPFRISAQSGTDADNYWILEDFNNFPVLDDWVIPPTNYPTYPNNVALTTKYANVEKGYDCAYGQNALRVRGVEEDGFVSFTVENASWVTFYITGKQKASDRGARIFRNGTLIRTYDGIDRYDCIEFTEKVDSPNPVTYKITGADDSKKDPFVLYYIEVQKYGIDISHPEPPQPNYEAYWIYEDFKHFSSEMDEWGDGIYNIQKNYLSLPNEIALEADSANVELGEGCSGGNERKVLRIRGKKYQGGKVEFTVPNAKNVSINVTGKSTYLDRTVKIFKDDVLVETFTNMDRTTCREYYEETNSDKPVTYRIEGGSDTEKPVAIKSIFVEKYGYSGLENIPEQTIKIYPNPAQEMVYFNTTNHEIIQSASIYDMNGRLVLLKNKASQMNVSGLKKGFYIIKLITSNGVLSHKLIKN
jgi:hypothetical protein